MLKVTSIYKKISLILPLFLSCTIIFAAVAGSSLLLPQSSFAQQASFGNPVHLDNSQGDQTDSHIASSGDNVYSSYSSEVNGAGEVLFTKTANKGASFSDPKVLSVGGHFAFLSDIAAAGDDVYVVWTDVTSESRILLVKSTDKGASFSDPVKVDSGTSNTNERSAVVAVSGNNVYVVWQDLRGQTSSLTPEIFFAVSTDGGATFSSPVNVSNNPGTLSKQPSIAAFGSNIYIVWTDCDTNGTNCKILYTKSSNAGSSFTTPVPLSGLESYLPDIKAFEDKVYVVYGQFPVGDPQMRDVFLLESTDAGSTFGSPINLSISLVTGSTNPLSNNPNIDVSGDNVAVTWEEKGPTSTPHWEIFFVGSTDGGSTFSEPISISSSLGDLDSTLNDVTISGRNVYSTWTTFEDGNYNIYFAAGTITPSLTPEEGIQKLIDTIDNMNLKKSIKTSLEGSLHNAIKLLTDNDPTNDKDVCSKLDSFIQKVNSKEANGQLTSQQAADLRQQATAIENTLGCSSSSPLLSRSLEADKSRGALVLPH